MAWTATEGSHVFRPWLADSVTRTAAFDLDADTFKAALYTNTGTPTPNVTSALSAYNAGSSQWVTANEVFQAGQWAQGGIALASLSVNSATASVVFWDANDTASGSAATLAAVYGVLVYDDTLTTPVADQGVCFNYLGGTNSVTNGTFTVVWNANGIWRATI
jgi:hypothetical protein